jgi:membrane-bound metal-dependent hydrolase YbcI (DUF457 family)
MNTQSHALMGAFFFGRGMPKAAWIGALGGTLPDIPMIVIVVALKASGLTGEQIFDQIYWQSWWQITNAIAHSFFLWGGLVVLSLVLRRTPDDFWSLAFVFAASGLLHCCIDFCVHREDAHMHFWPLTSYKFMSPVSYYDPAHYGRYFSLFEAALGLLMTAGLFRQFSNILVRLLLVILAALYVAVPAFFILSRT